MNAFHMKKVNVINIYLHAYLSAKSIVSTEQLIYMKERGRVNQQNTNSELSEIVSIGYDKRKPFDKFNFKVSLKRIV